MARNNVSISSVSDVGTNLGAVLLSLTSAGFASYFIFWAPAVNNGISQTPVSHFIASASEAQSDPIVTGSTTKPKKYLSRHYRIRGIDNSHAVFEIILGDETEEIEITIGDTIPSIGRVLAIESLNGNWYLQTDHGKLASNGTMPSGF
jgi:hypothetical protein